MKSGRFDHVLGTEKADIAAAVSGHSGDVTLAYKIVNKEPIMLSCYFPADVAPGKIYPTIFMIHGGGWKDHGIMPGQQSWEGDHLGFLARYFAGLGYTCVSIDYRSIRNMGQEEHYQLTDLCKDCADAVSYISNRSEDFFADPDNFFVLGESAGGYMAGALATYDCFRKFHFRGAFLFNPILNLEDAYWGSFTPKSCSHPMLAGKDPTMYRKLLSPQFHVTDTTCPVLLVHGDADTVVNPRHSFDFYTDMREKHRPCQLHLLSGINHAFLLAEYRKGNSAAIDLSIQLMRQLLGQLQK